MTCTHERIKTWLLADSHEPAGMWSCAHCGEKFLPITQALAEKHAGALAMREMAAKAIESKNGGGPLANIIRALPVEE